MVRRVLFTWMLAAGTGLAVEWSASQPARAENGWRFEGDESPVDSSFGPCCSRVAIGRVGEAYYAFGSARSGDADVYFTKTLDFGMSWSSPIKIDTDPLGRNRTGLYDLITNSTGSVLAFFLDDRGADTTQALRVNVSSDGGDSWLTTDVQISDGVRTGIATASFGADGSVYVSFGTDLYRSLDSGINWFRQRRFSSVIQACSDDRGNIYVTIGPPGNCYVDVSHDGGNKWKPESLFLSDSLAAPPRITCDEIGNVYVAILRRNANDTFTPLIHVSNDHGETYSAAVALGGEFSSISGPELAADCAGNVITSFAFGPTWINRSHDFGRTWLAEPQRVESPDAFSVFSAVDLTDDGHVYLAYSSVRENGRKIWFNISVDAGRTFFTSDMQASVSGADNPGIVADGQGHVYVTYQTILADLLRVGRAELGIGLTSDPDEATIVRVPPEGGRVSLSGFLRNQTVASTFSGVPATLEVLREDGSILGTIATKAFNLRPGATRGRSPSFRIPGGLMAGLYRWRLRIGSPIEDHATICMQKD